MTDQPTPAATGTDAATGPSGPKSPATPNGPGSGGGSTAVSGPGATQGTIIRRILSSSTMVSVLSVVIALILGGVLIAAANREVQATLGYFFARPTDFFVTVFRTVSEAYLALLYGAASLEQRLGPFSAIFLQAQIEELKAKMGADAFEAMCAEIMRAREARRDD